MKIDLVDISLKFSEADALLQHVNLTIHPGEYVEIRGPSGSGKSSFLRLLNRLAEPASGQILIDDQPLVSYDVVR